MNLMLQILPDNQISVRCRTHVSAPSFRFALLDSLQINSIRNNGTPHAAVAEPCRLPFRPPMIRYTLSDLHPGELSFAYTGPLRGFFLFTDESLHHFSFYNAWYPMGFDADTDFAVTLLHDNSKTLLNGTYDPVNRCWHYHAQPQAFSDCNILLYDPQACAAFENDSVRLLFFDREYRSSASAFAEKHAAIVQFYQHLYGHASNQKHTVVFLPQSKNAPGAYIRGDLIVFGETSPDKRRVLHILAHEMGHAYAVGADTESWEDWLNETHAEWSALLFTAHTAPDLFDALISELQERCRQQPIKLRPNGSARPQNVHTAGTWLYYGIYRQYGCDAIKMLLRTFDQLENKTTASFLTAVENESPKIAEIIRTACREH